MLASSLDDQHLVRSFANLLLQLGAKWRCNDVPSGGTEAHSGGAPLPQAAPSQASTSVMGPTNTIPEEIAAPPFDFAAFTSPTAPTSTVPNGGAAPEAPGLGFLITGLPRLDDVDLQFGLDPSGQSVSVDREQEALLQSLWHPSTAQTSTWDLDNSLSGLYDTLLGDPFATS